MGYGAYCGETNHPEGDSMPESRNLVLTHSQAACLIALRDGNETQPRIAMEARLALAKASATLRVLADLGLAEQDPTKRWHATRRGKACRFDTGSLPKPCEQGFDRIGLSGDRIIRGDVRWKAARSSGRPH